MLPHINRLQKRKEIERVFKKGKWFKEGCLILKVAHNDLSTSRFAFIISKKVSNKAIVRNRIRRIIQETIRVNLDAIKTGVDIILLATSAIKTKKGDVQEIKKTIKTLLIKAKLTKNNVNKADFQNN